MDLPGFSDCRWQLSRFSRLNGTLITFTQASSVVDVALAWNAYSQAETKIWLQDLDCKRDFSVFPNLSHSWKHFKAIGVLLKAWCTWIHGSSKILDFVRIVGLEVLPQGCQLFGSWECHWDRIERWNQTAMNRILIHILIPGFQYFRRSYDFQ